MPEMMSAQQAAEKWSVTKRSVSKYCAEGRIPGAELVGNSWAIPVSATKPIDGRVNRYKKGASTPSAPALTSIDLFSGPGGLATGFRWAGIRPLIAVEWSYWTAQTYSRSHDADILDLAQYLHDESALEPLLKPSQKTLLIQGDINLVSDDLILKILEKRFGGVGVDVVTGGAPCESFSMAGDRKEIDDRNQLYQNILRVARAVDAKMFLFENVKGLFSKKMDGRSGAMYSAICDDFESDNEDGGSSYRLVSRDKKTVLLRAVDFGVPQARERLFLVGLNNKFPNLEFEYPIKTHGPGANEPYVTVADALLDLPRLSVGCEVTKYTFDIDDAEATPMQRRYLRRMRGDLSLASEHVAFHADTLTNHKAPGHTAKMQERIKLIHPGENMRTASERLVEEGNGELVEKFFPRKIYAARNRRLKLNEPSFTVTSHCLDEMIHPIQDRGLSPREAARLQSFPDWYVFEGPYMKFHSDPDQDQYEQIGDAIPPLLAYALAKEIVKTLA